MKKTFIEWLKLVESEPAIKLGYVHNTLGDMYRVALIAVSKEMYKSE